MKQLTLEITVACSKPRISRTLSLPDTSTFDLFNLMIQASYGLMNRQEYAFMEKANGKGFSCCLFEEDCMDMPSDEDGVRNSMMTHLDDYFEKNEKLQYRYGVWVFNITLKKAEPTTDPYVALSEGIGKIIDEDCGGIYGQMAIKEAFTHYASEPIADYFRKMLKLKKGQTVDFDMDQSEFDMRVFSVESVCRMIHLLSSHMNDDEYGDDDLWDDLGIHPPKFGGGGPLLN